MINLSTLSFQMHVLKAKNKLLQLTPLKESVISYNLLTQQQE